MGFVSLTSLSITVSSCISVAADGIIPYDITCMWNLKYDTKVPIYKTEQTCGCQGREDYKRGCNRRLELADVSYYIWAG